jgi:hypothetical protein
MSKSWLDWAGIGQDKSPIRKTAVKLAAYGDIYNAGLGSMVMGSPFAPRLYSPGTSKLKPTEKIQEETRNSAIGGVSGLSLAYGAPKAAPLMWRFFTRPSAANRWLVNDLLHLPKPVASKVLRFGPTVATGSLAARIADGSIGVTQTDKMTDSPGKQGIKDLAKNWLIPAGQLGNVPGAIGYVVANGIADSAFRPVIRRAASSIVKPETIGKFMDNLSKTDPKGYAAMMLAGISMGESRVEKKIKRISMPSKIVYDQLRKKYNQLPETDLDGIQKSFDKAKVSLRDAIAKEVEKSDSNIARFIGDKFNRYPEYFNGLLDRMQSGDYAQSWSSRISGQPFFATSAAMEGIRDSATKYLASYVAEKLDTNPEVINALGGSVIGAGRAANNTRGMLAKNLIDTHRDQQVQIDQTNAVRPPLPQEKTNHGGK